jgi:hypothetical protein
VDILANIIDFEHMKLMDCPNDDGDEETSSNNHNNIEYENEAELRYKLMRSQVTTPSRKETSSTAFTNLVEKPESREEFKEMKQDVFNRVARGLNYDSDTESNQRRRRVDYIETGDETDEDIENPRRTYK